MGFFGGQAQAAAKPWFDGLEPVFVGQTNTTNINGITVTASSTIHTKGAWTQLIASTSAEGSVISLSANQVATNGANTATLLDIAVGASGSESVIIPDIAVGAATPTNFLIPIKIPSGSRVSARIQSVVASKTASIGIIVFNKFGSASFVPTSVDVLGIDTANSKGTTLAASNVWTEIIASTTKDYIAFSIAPSSSSSAIAGNTDATVQIGVGASGSEVIFGETFARGNASEQILMTNPRTPNLFGKEIPTGSRLSLRQPVNSTAVDGCIIAVPKP